ncbi:MAG: PadR family transcriptional regulator [Solirubrobacteraceae bacterium]
MTRGSRGSDGFGRELILGLLTEQPANCYQLDRRLEERFGSAGYTDGTARQAIKRLVDDGLVHARSGSRVASTGGIRARATVYEPTPAGIERFEEWMWAAVSTPPVREELHAKIALCRPPDLPRMVCIVRDAESVCAGKLQSLNHQVRAHRGTLDEEDFRGRMDLVVSTGDQAWWESRIKWLQRVRIYLEDERARYSAQLREPVVVRQT